MRFVIGKMSGMSEIESTHQTRESRHSWARGCSWRSASAPAFGGLGAVLQAWLLPQLASDPDQLRLAHEYLTAMRCAVAVLIIPLAGTFAFRALGSTTPSAKVMSQGSRPTRSATI